MGALPIPSPLLWALLLLGLFLCLVRNILLFAGVHPELQGVHT